MKGKVLSLSAGLDSFYKSITKAARKVKRKPSIVMTRVPVKESEAMAVHPRSVPKFREDAKKRGVPTEFTRDGSPIFTSRNHQKRYLKAYGYFNRDAGYGD